MRSKKLILFFLFGCLLSARLQAQEKSSTELRVLCYNVHHCSPPSLKGGIDIEAIAGVINKLKPDLVALQEIDVNTQRSGKGIDQAKELGRLTGLNAFFVKTIDYEGGEYGIAILSRFPLKESLGFELPMEHNAAGEPRGVAAVLIEPKEGKTIAFASTHFDLKEENKELQINAITDYMRDVNIPVILAGDFNATPDSYVIKELDKVFERTCTDCAPTIPVVNPKRVIDFIAFYPQNAFEVVEHVVINETYASDHLPVFARLLLE